MTFEINLWIIFEIGTFKYGIDFGKSLIWFGHRVWEYQLHCPIYLAK